MAVKTSIRFFNNKEVRAVWENENNKWWFCVVDVCAILAESSNPAVYWRVMKQRLKAQGNQTVTKCNAFKFTAGDGKKRLFDTLDSDGVIQLAKVFPNKMAMRFVDWFVYSDNTIDGQSKKKAYALFETGLLDGLEAGTIKCLQQIHAYIFGGLYDFAGQIRSKNISKGGFTFAPCQYVHITLPNIEKMPETTFDEIVDKYVEMNVAHPFMEGNGRSARIWLDLMLRRSLKKCVDWSKITKNDYMNAMKTSVADSTALKAVLQSALTNKINDREMFMKGIDYSYYYEQEDIFVE
jgi:cell filamentation protein